MYSPEKALNGRRCGQPQGACSQENGDLGGHDSHSHLDDEQEGQGPGKKAGDETESADDLQNCDGRRKDFGRGQT